MAKFKGMSGHLMFSQTDDIVEQQTRFIDGVPQEPIVHNILRPEYAWDVDDNISYMANGMMKAGDIFKFEQKFIADVQSHLFHIGGNFMRHRSFILKFSIPEIGFEYQSEFENYGKICLLGPSCNSTDYRLQPIEGSNGRGIKSTAVFEITALDSSPKASFGANIRYACHQILDGLCGGHESEIISWNPVWRLVESSG